MLQLECGGQKLAPALTARSLNSLVEVELQFENPLSQLFEFYVQEAISVTADKPTGHAVLEPNHNQWTVPSHEGHEELVEILRGGVVSGCQPALPRSIVLPSGCEIPPTREPREQPCAGRHLGRVAVQGQQQGQADKQPSATPPGGLMTRT